MESYGNQIHNAMTKSIGNEIYADDSVFSVMSNDTCLTDTVFQDLIEHLGTEDNTNAPQNNQSVVTEEMPAEFVTFIDEYTGSGDLMPLVTADPSEIAYAAAQDSHSSFNLLPLVTADPSEITFAATPEPPSSVESYTDVLSPTSSIMSYDNIESVITVGSPNSVDLEVSQSVSPTEVFGERKRKRGRKPKSESGLCDPTMKAKKAKKIKIYEIDHPLEDKEMERKRLNAINAKRHRVMQKEMKESLEKQLQDVKNERDSLKMEVEALRKREAMLTQQVYKSSDDQCSAAPQRDERCRPGPTIPPTRREM